MDLPSLKSMLYGSESYSYKQNAELFAKVHSFIRKLADLNNHIDLMMLLINPVTEAYFMK